MHSACDIVKTQYEFLNDENEVQGPEQIHHIYAK